MTPVTVRAGRGPEVVWMGCRTAALDSRAGGPDASQKGHAAVIGAQRATSTLGMDAWPITREHTWDRITTRSDPKS